MLSDTTETGIEFNCLVKCKSMELNGNILPFIPGQVVKLSTYDFKHYHVESIPYNELTEDISFDEYKKWEKYKGTVTHLTLKEIRDCFELKSDLNIPDFFLSHKNNKEYPYNAEDLVLRAIGIAEHEAEITFNEETGYIELWDHDESAQNSYFREAYCKGNEVDLDDLFKYINEYHVAYLATLDEAYNYDYENTEEQEDIER